jgi:tyrosine-protein kinase Etk/Wzc
MELARQRFSLDVVRDELSRLDPVGAATRTNEVATIQSEISAFDGQITALRLQAEQYYAVDPSLRGAESRVPELAEITRSLAHYESQKQNAVRRLGDAMAGQRMGDGGGYGAALQAQQLQLQSTIRGLEAEVNLLDSRLGTTSSLLGGVPQAAVQLEQLERRRGIVASWYATFLQDLQRVMVAEQSELGYVELVSPAYAPSYPARPNLPQNTILGLLLGLGFGVGLALARHAAERGVRRPDELAEQGYRVLGVIPTMNTELRSAFGRKSVVEVEGRSVSTKLLTALAPWSPVAENFRLIRTNLLHGLDGAGMATEVFGPDGTKVEDRSTARSVLITSPESGAGKTVSASNLAVALGAGGLRTLLIDADLRRPSAHSMFGVDGSRGLADILQASQTWPDDEPSLSDFEPLKTGLDNLYFLPAGRPERPPSELVGSERFSELLERARPVFDVVVVDSPPVLAAADAVLLAKQVDSVILIVSAERTDRRAVEQTRRALESVGHPVTGLIVNRFDEHQSYGYSYGYTGPSTYGETPAEPAAA